MLFRQGFRFFFERRNLIVAWHVHRIIRQERWITWFALMEDAEKPDQKAHMGMGIDANDEGDAEMLGLGLPKAYIENEFLQTL